MADLVETDAVGAGENGLVENGDMTSPAGQDGDPRWSWRDVAWWLTFALVPTLFLSFFLCTRMPPGRILIGTAALICTVVGIAKWTRAGVASRRDLLAAMLIGVGVTMMFTLMWNEAYLNFVKLLNPQKEVFRTNMWKAYTPFYGRLRVSYVLPCVPAVVLLIGIGVALWKWRITQPMRRWGLPLIMIVQLAMIAALATTDLGYDGGRERIGGESRGFQIFRDDVDRFHFKSVRELYSAYVPLMERLNYFSQHYPPGPQTIFLVEHLLNVRPLFGWLTAVCICLATPFIYLAAKAVSDKPLVHNTSALAFAAAPGLLLYPLVSATPIIVLPGAIALWALLRGMRGFIAAVLLGGVLGTAMITYAILSFSAIFFAIVMGLIWLACVYWRLAKLSNLAIVAAIAILTIGFLMLELRVYTKFDLRTCSMVAVHLQHIQANTSGFDTPGKWFMRSTGNALAFTLANLPLVGIAVASVFALRRTDSGRLERLIMPFAVLTIVLSAMSGKFYLETERVWTLFLPFLTLGAAVEIGRENRAAEARVAVMAMLLFVVVQEIIFVHGAF